MPEKPPVLIGYAVPGEQVKAWCPYCLEWHTHGIPGETVKSRIVGHWTAHCSRKDSPLKSTGYEIKIMTKADIRAIAASLDLYG